MTLLAAPVKNCGVLFSHEAFYLQEWGGILRGFCELSKNIHDKYGNCNVYAGEYCGSMARDLKRDLGEKMIGREVGQVSGRLACNLRGERGLRQRILTTRPSVLHRTQYNVLDFSPRSLSVVSTLHDTWTEREGGDMRLKLRSLFKRRALEQSDIIVCVSQNTRKELARIWPHLHDRAVVIYHGSRPISDTPQRYAADFPYFLYVGSREERKNFPIVLKALSRSRQLTDMRLICVGPPFSDEEKADIALNSLERRVTREKANDHQLAGLYEGALALLYPSRFEGFGMPLLEAMHHRCPVISSPATCLAEIGGEAALYADPDAPDEWVTWMEAVAFDEELAEDLRNRGRSHALTFSWERCADEHLAIYQDFSVTAAY